MKALGGLDMIEVTRLTRAGRLLEATGLLQRELGVRRRRSPRSPDTDTDTNTDTDTDTDTDSDTLRLGCRSTSVGKSTLRMPDGPPRWPSDSSFGQRKVHQEPLDLEAPVRRDRRGRGPSLPPGASFECRLVATAAGGLDYKLYVPSGHVQGLAPLVVMLHGCTQNPDDFAAGTRMNELAELLDFYVAYPAQSKTANASQCWNWFKASEQRRDRGEPSLVANATRQIISQHPVDPKRVFVAGLSAGGAAAAILGCIYPDIYAGVGVHSGLACGAASDLPSAFQAMRGGAQRRVQPVSDVPTIVFHGSADRTVGPSNADAVVDQVAIRSGPAIVERGTTTAGMRYVRTVRRADGGLPASEKWMVEGAGHAWFGGDLKGSYTDPRGPDASREMLRFFDIIPAPH